VQQSAEGRDGAARLNRQSDQDAVLQVDL